MTEKKILFPTDFSDLNLAALPFAAAQATAGDAKLLIVHVVETGSTAGESALYTGLAAQSPSERLASIVPEGFEGDTEHRVLYGRPAEEIVRFAETQHVDLIVMGTQGRTGLMRALLGSVAEEVVRRAKCPVLIVRPQKA